MSKLNEIIEKIKGLQTQLSEKVDKITFIKKWREKRTGAAKKLDPTSLSAIYREGSTGTRIQVLVIYAFLFVALISAGSLVRKIIIKEIGRAHV